ncbi:MAG TPA: methyltransferase domain-containing protein [Gemmataceae bacterium]|nr:methyltransferase domain-containing protein [Gemmataceae bacterium]
MSHEEILKANEVYHDVEAGAYDATMPYIRNSFAQAIFNADIATIMGLLKHAQKPLSVLDCGAGTGNLTLLKFLALGCAVTAVDISRGMLERLRGKVSKADESRLQIVHGDVDTSWNGRPNGLTSFAHQASYIICQITWPLTGTLSAFVRMRE